MSNRRSYRVLVVLIASFVFVGFQPHRLCAQPSKADAPKNGLPTGATAQLGSTDLRHSGAVLALAVTKDAITSIGADGLICRWDLASGKAKSRFSCAPNTITEGLATLSRDGSLAASHVNSANGADKVVIWETATGRIRSRIDAPRLFVQLLAQGRLSFSADGKILAVGNLNGTIGLHDTTTGKLVRKLTWKDHRFQDLAFSPDGTQLAAVVQSDGAGIAIWEVATGKRTQTIAIPKDRLATVTFSPDGKLLATGSDNGKIQLWDLATGKVRQSLEPKGREQAGLPFFVFSPDGRHIAIGDVSNPTMLLWNPANGKTTTQLQGIAGPYCAAFTPDSKTLVTGDYGNLIRLWTTKTGKEVRPRGDRGIVKGPLALAPDGKTFATINPLGGVDLRSYPEAKVLRTVAKDSNPVSLAFSPDSKLLVLGGADGKVRFVDVTTGKKQREFLAHFYKRDGEPRTAASVAFSPDGKTLATGGFDSTVRLWDVVTGKPLHVLRDRRGWVFCVAFSPDGKTVVGSGCSSISTTPCIWAAKTGKLLLELEKSHAMTLAFSKNGDVLVTAGGLFGGWFITFTDTKTGEVLTQFDNLKTRILDAFTSAKVSPDGRTLALGSARGIALWDMATRKEIRRIQGKFGSCTDLFFSLDGKTLVASHGNGTVLFWDVSDRAKKP